MVLDLDRWREEATMVRRAETLPPDAIAPGDRILVCTSGHSQGSPDATAEVVEVLGDLVRVLHVRLSGGRDVFYAAGRAVHRLPARR
jgi:hypothetical protein